MVDAEEGKLKAEIDAIVQNIEDTMKKIEQVVPLKPGTSEQSDAGPSEAQGRQDPPPSQNPELQS